MKVIINFIGSSGVYPSFEYLIEISTTLAELLGWIHRDALLEGLPPVLSLTTATADEAFSSEDLPKTLLELCGMRLATLWIASFEAPKDTHHLLSIAVLKKHHLDSLTLQQQLKKQNFQAMSNHFFFETLLAEETVMQLQNHLPAEIGALVSNYLLGNDSYLVIDPDELLEQTKKECIPFYMVNVAPISQSFLAKLASILKHFSTVIVAPDASFKYKFNLPQQITKDRKYSDITLAEAACRKLFYTKMNNELIARSEVIIHCDEFSCLKGLFCLDYVHLDETKLDTFLPNWLYINLENFTTHQSITCKTNNAQLANSLAHFAVKQLSKNFYNLGGGMFAPESHAVILNRRHTAYALARHLFLHTYRLKKGACWTEDNSLEEIVAHAFVSLNLFSTKGKTTRNTLLQLLGKDLDWFKKETPESVLSAFLDWGLVCREAIGQSVSGLHKLPLYRP